MTTLQPTAPPIPRTTCDPRLDAIRERALAGERLTIAEGEILFETPDIWTVCDIADRIRRRLHGDVAYYNVNRHLNYSNVCALSCTFCEFHRKRGQEGAYEHSIDHCREEARRAVEAGATEMHVVGGLNPYLPFGFYTDLVRAIREEALAADSLLHVKAFTAVEIVHLAKIARRFKADDRKAGIRWVLERLKEAGLGSLPGGGAEVFDDRVHDEAFKGKIRSDVWLDVHRVAHELGLNTNATILYGHIEDRRERLVHMDMLRRAQDEALTRMGYESAEQGTEARRHEGTEWSEADVRAITLTRPDIPLAHVPAASESDPSSHRASVPSCLCAGSFQAIIPLPFFPDGSALEHLPGPTGLENLRTLAICRLMLDNFPHVKAFWIMQTLGMAQTMLQCGADDIDGTVVWYDITKVGGAGTHQETTVADLKRVIREAGCTPVERDTLYRRVRRDGKRWWIEAQT